MLKQLKDYTYRPALRVKKTEPNLFKYVHATGGIVPVAPEKKEKEGYRFTKKNTAHLLSPSLRTCLPGANQYLDGKLMPSMGLLFDSRPCQIKAMSREMMDSYEKEWVSSLANVQYYKRFYGASLFTDPDEFKEATLFDRQPNEVLAKFTREALVAVVILNDTPEWRELARKYALEIYRELQIDLPIYRHDCIYGVMENISEEVKIPEKNCTIS